LVGEHDPLGKSFGEALEVAKRQQCKYANSIRTGATEELASLIGTNRFTGLNLSGNNPEQLMVSKRRFTF
jgi:hypothetical protein